MGVTDWYKEYLSKRRQEEQNLLNDNNSGFRGFSNPSDREINKKIYDSYINQGNDAQSIQDTQRNGASLKSTVGNVAEGFAKGGPIGAIVAAAQAQKKASANARRNAIAMGKQAIQNAEDQTRAIMGDSDTQYTQSYNPNDYNVYGQITGGAAPVVQEPQAAEIQQQENLKRGLMDKFLSGISDFSRGYQENLNNGFNPNNLTADKFTETTTTPANTQKITDYQNQLANDTAYNDWATRAGVDKAAAIKAIEEGKNSGNADVDNWIKNNQDAYKEQKETKTYDKGKMARAGEFLGSAARIAQNPLVQGLVAGGLSAALTGNPLYGLGQGYKFANNRAMSNVYGDILKQYGIDVPNMGMFGNISDSDMRNIGNMAETHAWHEYLNQKNADELARKIAKDEADKEYKANRIQVQQQNADTNAYKAKNGSKVTHISNGGSKKTGSSSVTGTKNPNYNQALAQYYDILQSGDARKISYARKRFMQETGIDPDTKIKQTAKKQGSASAPSSDEEAFLKEIGW